MNQTEIRKEPRDCFAVLQLFPEPCRQKVRMALESAGGRGVPDRQPLSIGGASHSRQRYTCGLQEIRFRIGRPVLFYIDGEEWFATEDGSLQKTLQPTLQWIASRKEILQIIQHICRYSMYAYEEELGKGFISTAFGCRVGVAGEVLMGTDGSVKNIRCISSLNIRVAHEAKGIAGVVLPYLYEEKKLCSTLLISPPGCGKTTLLRLIAGDIEMSNLDSDETCGITMSGKQNIGFLRQINFTDGDVPVKEELEKAFSEVFACEARKKEIEKLLAETEDHKKLLAEYDFLERRIESLHGYSWKKDMETMFQKFGFALEDLEKPIGEFSGGQQTKIALIQLLLQRPDILLLDEPTNHLDIAAVEWLENYLKSYENAVVIVSHDRMFLDRVIDVTYEIEYGDIKRYPGNYSAFVRLKEEAQIKQEKDYEAQQKEIERLTAWIEKWKNTPTKVAATRSKRMAIEHMVKIEKPRRFDTKTFHALFHPARESYTDVLTMKKLKIGYDTVLSEVSAVIKKAERIAIIGENGKGKSTLLKTVVGEINPLGGSYQFGNRVDFAYFDQHKAVNQKFDPEQTVLDYFWSLYPNLLRNDVRSALGAFLFSGEDVEKKMGQLSGGEKVRLELCRIFYTKPNFLILDEPTNHMDLAGKEALEKMLTSYEGTVLFVSHDRYFINQVATGILEFGESDVQFYEMNYAQYLEEIKRQTPGRETGNAGGAVRKPADVPTLDDVFDKKKYYNPGKILSRLKRQLEKYEEQLAESESRMSELQLEMMDPELSADYERLMELQTKIDEENQTQESLLERMMETELELEEMETQDE